MDRESALMGKIKSLKVTTLADNLVQVSGFHGQWGLSFLIDLIDSRGQGRRIIFDTGHDRAPLMHNIRRLRVDLSEVDCVVLSHGHGDHTAATVEVARASGGVKVYAHPNVFMPRFTIDERGRRNRGGVPRGEGIHDIEKAGGEVVLSSEPVEVFPGVWTTGQIPRITPFEQISPPFGGGKRVIVIDGREVDDAILDDQALFMEVEGVGPFVITGCAHAGPINTLHRAKELGGYGSIFGFVGGTHLVHRPDDYIRKTVEALRAFRLKLLMPCHCTGFKATADLLRAFPNEFALNFCGRIIEAGKLPEPILI